MSIKRKVKYWTRKFFDVRISSNDLLRVLESLQVSKSRNILAHTSLSTCGYFLGGAPRMVNTLRSYADAKANLVLPTHSWDAVARGLRIFDESQTQSCVGAVTEWFRKQPDVLRSLHPTHSVGVMGPDAAALIDRHFESEGPCGYGSPYHKLLELDATILFVGASIDSNTSYHCCEGLARMPYLLQKEQTEFRFVPKMGDGFVKKIQLHQPRVARKLDDMHKNLWDLGILKSEKLGKGFVCSIRGRDFMHYLMDRLSENPRFLLRD